MQGSAWIDLLRRIPAELHDALAFGLVTGEEVVVQQLLKLESDFVIVRGRMAGTTVEGRLMMVPYAHMALVAFNKQLAEPDVQAMFGKTAEPIAAPTPLAERRSAADIAMPAKPSSVSDPNLPKPAKPGQAKPPPPSKSILLARLRERLAEKAK